MQDPLKSRVCAAIDDHCQEIIAWGEAALSTPELGYREGKTSQLVRKAFDLLDIPYTYPLALTGVKGKLRGKQGKSNVCIIGEMDAVTCYGHPCADNASGTAHACGHNAQIAAMLGAAYGLSKSGVMSDLWGDVSFFAVPAEEYIDIPYRRRLRETGAVHWFGGKQQLIADGAFDDVSIAMMIHSKPEAPQPQLHLMPESLGFMFKEVRFLGKEAHGSEPEKGINALNAAMLALMGIHANRETFRDEDKIRIHPIITNGGEVVNSVPSRVELQTYIRGKSAAAISDAARKVDCAVKGAALMVGACAEIETDAGYLPLCQSEPLSRIFEENARLFIPQDKIYYGGDMTGSTDMGDLSCLIPCIHPLLGGFSGAAHSREFRIADPEIAYIASAKMLAMTVVDLLADHAAAGERVQKDFTARMSKEEYLQYLTQNRRNNI